MGHEVAPGTIANILKEQADRAFVLSIRKVLEHGGPGKVS